MRRLLASFPNLYFVDPVGVAGTKGRLAIEWLDGFNFEIVHSNLNMINVIIKSNFSMKEWLLTCFYGSLYPSDKHVDWNFLEKNSF